MCYYIQSISSISTHFFRKKGAIAVSSIPSPHLHIDSSASSPNGAHKRANSHLETDTSDKYPDLLTVREVARRLRVDDTTVRRWIKTGTLTAVILPHRGKRSAYRVRADTLAALLAAGVPDENA